MLIWKKIVIFCAGRYGKLTGEYILSNSQDEIVAFIDNNENINSVEIKGQIFDVKRATDLKTMHFDKIIIAVDSSVSIAEIKEQIATELSHEVNTEVMIEEDYFYDIFPLSNYYNEFADKRVSFLRNYARYCHENNIQGNVAECGVFTGEFSSYINSYFNDRKLYMFDTFEGFNSDDLNKEYEIDNDDTFKNGFFSNSNNHFNVSYNLIDIVKRRMKFIDQCEIIKGWFPESAKDVDDSFCFVNLDMDLYAPMYEGIKFFYDKMVKGGVILLHDYFHTELPGVKKAVYDFEKDNKIDLVKIPIGDDCSLAIIKI